MGLAALALGAGHVVMIEIDERSMEIATDNVARNGYEAKVPEIT